MSEVTDKRKVSRAARIERAEEMARNRRDGVLPRKPRPRTARKRYKDREPVQGGQERFDGVHELRQELIRRPFGRTQTVGGCSHSGAGMAETVAERPYEWVERALQGLTGADVAKIMEED
jgi:hypothetical protein